MFFIECISIVEAEESWLPQIIPWQMNKYIQIKGDASSTKAWLDIDLDVILVHKSSKKTDTNIQLRDLFFGPWYIYTIFYT